MKYILITFILLQTMLFAVNSDDKQRELRIKKQLEIEIQNEKKYAQEQTFYNEANYNFKGAEVNEESIKKLNEIEVDELDMDSVYD